MGHPQLDCYKVWGSVALECAWGSLHFGSIDKEIVSYLCNAVDYISVRDEEAQKELGMAHRQKKFIFVPDSVLSVRNIIDIQKTKEIFSA